MRRILAAALPLCVLLGIGCYFAARQDVAVSSPRKKTMDELVLSAFGLGRESTTRLDARFQDQDSDLVADCPVDTDAQIVPEKLMFCFIGGDESKDPERVWTAVFERLAEATGIACEYVSFATVEEQLAALDEGRLHVTAFNSGAVPLAVSRHGFVPVCTYGPSDGPIGYRMRLVVRKDSPVRDPSQLRDRELVFTHLTSNSGFKAAFVALMADYDLLPERDYRWAFSGGHIASLRALSAGRFDAAAVASDLLDQAIDRGEIEPDRLRSIYESELFPPAAIGYVYNLQPQIAQKIRDALVGFSFKGTPLADEFASSNGEQFVQVTYKDDWSTIRRIEDMLADSRQIAR